MQPQNEGKVRAKPQGFPKANVLGYVILEGDEVGVLGPAVHLRVRLPRCQTTAFPTISPEEPLVLQWVNSAGTQHSAKGEPWNMEALGAGMGRL